MPIERPQALELRRFKAVNSHFTNLPKDPNQRIHELEQTINEYNKLPLHSMSPQDYIHHKDRIAKLIHELEKLKQ